jgi:hypothetical protein
MHGVGRQKAHTMKAKTLAIKLDRTAGDERAVLPIADERHCRRSERLKCWARTGWTSMIPKSSMFCGRCRGRSFSALQLVCAMYAGIRRIEPGMDIRVDLAQEYEMAERLGWVERE